MNPLNLRIEAALKRAVHLAKHAQEQGISAVELDGESTSTACLQEEFAAVLAALTGPRLLDAGRAHKQMQVDAQAILRLLNVVDEMMGSTSGATEHIQEHADHILATIRNTVMLEPGDSDSRLMVARQAVLSLVCDPSRANDEYSDRRSAYQAGHRDACHSAATLLRGA